MASVALVGSLDFSSPFRLLYNSSASAPRGWYWQHPTDRLMVNDFALAWLPEPARALAHARGYLPRSTPLLKRVGATQGHWVCYRDGGMWINWRRVGLDRAVDGTGRPLVPWKDCRRLNEQEYFLLSVTNDASFDSRYFGPVSLSDVLGEAIPLWVW